MINISYSELEGAIGSHLLSPDACSCDGFLSPLTLQTMSKPPKPGFTVTVSAKTDQMTLKIVSTDPEHIVQPENFEDTSALP